jgi:DNA-binding transcriptional MerR regulator
MQKLDNPAPLITISRAAAIMGVSIKTLRRWESEGKLKPHRNRLNHRLYSLTQLTKLQQKTPLSPQHKLTISEAAKHIGVSIKTLRRWDNSGKVACRRDNQGNRIYDQLTLDQLKTFKTQSEWVRLAPVRQELQSFGYKPLYPLIILLIINSALFAINNPIYNITYDNNAYYKNIISGINNDLTNKAISPLTPQNAPIKLSAAIHPDYELQSTPNNTITGPTPTIPTLPTNINIDLGPVVASDFQQLTQSGPNPTIDQDKYIEMITNIYKEYLIQTNINKSTHHLDINPQHTIPPTTPSISESNNETSDSTSLHIPPTPQLTEISQRIYDNSPPPTSSLSLTALENTENGPMEELFALQHQVVLSALSGNNNLYTFQTSVPANQTQAQLVVNHELYPTSPIYLTPTNDYSPALRYWASISPGCSINETNQSCSTITIHFDQPVAAEVSINIIVFNL